MSDPHAGLSFNPQCPTCQARAAEPRWPSGPDAERELAMVLSRHFAVGVTERARAILAALQEKRDPGE